ncbi:MAG: enoyl-CoA hydratase/isomerase family protein [Microthrixaceae bacterium]
MSADSFGATPDPHDTGGGRSETDHDDAAGPEPDLGDAEIALTREGPITTLWLNRPSKRNAVTYSMWLDIARLCGELAADSTVRMLVVRGSGEHFCAGADIAGLGDVEMSEYQAANVAADEAIAAFPKPTLAVITGACVGGGTEIAVACDLRFADTTARFGITPARLGIVYPASATQRVVQAIGASATKHLLYSAELIDAERALRIGLVEEVHPTGSLDTRVTEFTELLTEQRSLLTQMASKEIVDAAVARDVDPTIMQRWSTEVAESADPIEGVVAYLEGRPPEFTWTPTLDK